MALNGIGARRRDFSFKLAWKERADIGKCLTELRLRGLLKGDWPWLTVIGRPRDTDDDDEASDEEVEGEE